MATSKEVQRLETIISKITQENSSLASELDSQNLRLQQEITHRQYLESKVQCHLHSAGHSIISVDQNQSLNEQLNLNRDSSDFSELNRLSLLENVVSSQSQELTFLKKQFQEKTHQILLLQSKVEGLVKETRLRTEQIQSLNLKLRLEENKNLASRTREQKLMDVVEKSRQKHFSMSEDQQKLKQNLAKLQKENVQLIRKCLEEMRSLNQPEDLELSQSEGEAATEKEKELVELINYQQRQLDFRSESLCDLVNREPDQLTLPEASLKNTILNLKKELAKKVDLTRKVIQRLKCAEALVENYADKNSKMDEQIKQNASLYESRNLLEKKVDQLTIQHQEVSIKLQEKMAEQGMLKTKMCAILEENQCYHQFMNAKHGQNYLNIIQAEKNQLRSRSYERGQHREWATVEELVEMNCKLMRRVK